MKRGPVLECWARGIAVWCLKWLPFCYLCHYTVSLVELICFVLVKFSVCSIRSIYVVPLYYSVYVFPFSMHVITASVSFRLAFYPKGYRLQRQQSLRYKEVYLSDRCQCDRWRVVECWTFFSQWSQPTTAIVAIIWKLGLIYRNNHNPPYLLNCYLYDLQTYRTHSSKLRLLLVYTVLIFLMEQSKMQTADWLRTIVFRVRKQCEYCCHVLICMVKTIVRSLRFTLTVFPIVDFF